jgi:CubicO group peptidase (beta-lactamase class C family)
MGSHRWLLLVAALAAACGGSDSRPAIEATGLDQRIERIESGMVPAVLVRGESVGSRTIQSLMAEHGIPAASVAVISEGRLDWAKGYGTTQIEGGDRTTSQTLFLAGQISQGVAALGALRLVQDGLISLDEDVNGKLTSWQIPATAGESASGGGTSTVADPGAAPPAGPVTLRRILNHTSNLSVPSLRGYLPGDEVPTLLQILNGEPPASNAPIEVIPPTANRPPYSVGGFIVLQQLIEDLTGQSYADYIHDAVLDRAGMDWSNHSQPLTEELAARAASGYEPDGTLVPGRWRIYPELAAAGMWTTPSDLARLVLAMQYAHAGGSRRAELTMTLSSELMAEVFKEQAPGRGLGFEIGGEGEWQHFRLEGHGNNYLSELFAYVSQGRGAVVMTNSSRGEILKAHVLRAIAVEYGWPDLLPEEVDRVALSPESLAEIEGRYSLRTSTEWTVRLDGDSLLLETASGGSESAAELVPIAEDLFVQTAFGTRYRVERGPDGSVAGLTFILNGRDLFTIEKLDTL